GIAHGTVGQLARKRGVLEGRLAARKVARLASSLAGAGRLHCLHDDLARLGGVLLEELTQRTVDHLLNEALDRRVAELGLRLALELRLGNLHRDDRGESLAHVLALEVVLFLLEELLLPRVGIERASEGGAEAREVRAALM